MIKISYLGPGGTFTEEALNRYCDDLNEEVIKVPCDTIDEAIEICGSIVDYALVPVENSLGGSVVTTMDYLMKNQDIEIDREFIMPIAHYIYGISKVDFKNIEVIHSHPQALRQCDIFLKEKIPNSRMVTENSTADAANRILSLGNIHHCVIGSSALEHIYPIVKLAGPIQNNSENWTRFFLLKKKKEDTLIKSGNKLSLVCRLDGLRPGALYEALGIFAHRNINLVHIESRPIGKRLGEYKFFFDLEIIDHDNVDEAIMELRKIADTLNILGIYDALNL